MEIAWATIVHSIIKLREIRHKPELLDLGKFAFSANYMEGIIYAQILMQASSHRMTQVSKTRLQEKFLLAGKVMVISLTFEIDVQNRYDNKSQEEENKDHHFNQSEVSCHSGSKFID